MKHIGVGIVLLVMASPAAADTDFSESVAVMRGGTLEIDLDSGSIEVETHEKLEVQVDAYAAGGWFGSSMRFELSSDGGDAELKGDSRGLFSRGARVRVRVPREFSLDARTGGGKIQIEALDGQVEARTSGGPIELDGARGDVQLRTSGGHIRVENVRGELEAQTSGGTIRVSEVTGDVDLDTSGGRIEIFDVLGAVKARTSGGSIAVRFTGDPEGDLQTSGGGITAEVPRDARFDLEAETSGGRVTVDRDLHLEGQIESQRVRGEINGGGGTLKLRTSGGNVRVQVR
jgi:DUF4097 and DUF4098 domain-containing protein YvlB